MSAITEQRLREGGYMVTASGRRVSVRDPQPEEISLSDIAHHLSMQCRYAGGTRFHYSVAQHSWLCWSVAFDRDLDLDIQRACLMHDAAEAYCGDLIWPVKNELRLYSDVFDAIEWRFAAAIAARFGLVDGYDRLPEVHEIDMQVCAREQTVLRRMPDGWEPHVEPALVGINSWTIDSAQRSFEARAADLGIKEER